MNQTPNYTLTLLSSYLYKKVLKAGHPNGFCVYNFGDGPVMAYRTHQCRAQSFSLRLKDGGQKIHLSHNSPAPYLVVLLQEQPDRPILTVVYTAGTEPVVEQGEEKRLRGQILVSGQSQFSGKQVAVQALYWPQSSHVIAAGNRYNSMLMDGSDEVYWHLLICGGMIDRLLSSEETEEVQNENDIQLYGQR